MNTFSLKHVGDRPDGGEGFHPAGLGVSPSGAALFLFVEQEASKFVHEKETQPGWAVFPISKMENTYRFRLIVHDGDVANCVDGAQLNFTFPIVDVFPDGRVLFVGPRCEWRANNKFELNGCVFDPETQDHQRFLVGDGIEGACVDTAGRIWISYFDEGVIGNYGWGGPGPEPIGASGLNRFDADGTLDWRFPYQSNGRFITDCYAMNVIGTDAYIYYYDDFSLCLIQSDNQVRFWDTGLSGCHHFAVSGKQVLFSGQYQEPLSRFHLMAFENDRLSRIKVFDATLPNGQAIESGQIFARGDSVFFFDENAFYQASIEDLI